MRRLILPVLAGLLIIGFGAFVFLNSANIALLSPAGPIAAAERSVFLWTLILAATVVLPVFLMLFYFAWRYRAHTPEAKVQHAPNWDHDNWIAEVVWWFIPAVIIVCLGVIAWNSSHALDPWKPLQSEKPAFTVQVVALDWKWLFIYPEQGIATVNMLEIPEGTPIHFVMTADAPMNQFWVPRLGGQVMVMPGMQTQLNLLASSTGTYEGKSSEISGKGFASMNFTVQSVSQNDFDAWVQSVKQKSNPLTSSAYDGLAQPSSYVPPMSYSSVAPNLYAGVIMKYMSGTNESVSTPDMNTMGASAMGSTTMKAATSSLTGTAQPL